MERKGEVVYAKFTAVQAAKKDMKGFEIAYLLFTAVQAAKKIYRPAAAWPVSFTAVQAAKKIVTHQTAETIDVHCRTGS